MNNRQAGRRRGRGGQRSQGNPNQGNRIDNRARGNAAQLHEKYKNLARDAQMQGDRVQTEYYLQFADHYFRVLSESRSRFEDNRRQQDEGDEDEIDGEEQGQAPRRAREGREEGRLNGRANGANGHAEADENAGERAARGNGSDRQEEAKDEPAPRRRGRPRREPQAEEAGVEADRLPPALGASDEEKPRRRRGRPRAEEAAPPAAE